MVYENVHLKYMVYENVHVTIFKGLGVGTQHLVFNIALRVEVVERTRHKEDLIQLNVLISLSQSH